MDRLAKREANRAAAQPSLLGPRIEHLPYFAASDLAQRFWPIVFTVIVTNADEYKLAEQQNAFLRSNA